MPEDASSEGSDALLSSFDRNIRSANILRSLDEGSKDKSKKKENADDDDNDRPPFQPG